MSRIIPDLLYYVWGDVLWVVQMISHVKENLFIFKTMFPVYIFQHTQQYCVRSPGVLEEL